MRLTQIEHYSHNAFSRATTIGLWLLAICVASVLIVWFWYTHNNSAPSDFPLEENIVITDGMNQSDITDTLEDAGVVRSSLLLHILLTREFEGVFVQAGTYHFTEPLSTRQIAEALTTGKYRSPLVSITLPEGFRVSELYIYLPASYQNASPLDEALYEGTFFPDTYFISSDANMEDILELLTSTMKEKIAPYKDAIAQSSFTEEEVIILASIIEREANDETSMKLVSGILQNRLADNMPLQVDATLDYILNKTSAELTLDDLEIDSGFNTYNNTGLPPHPIANPGLTAIEAVLYPTESEYLYYLTGDDGVFYYAKTFEEHKRNKARYIE